MKEKCLKVLRKRDFEYLIKTPEEDLVGEIIKLNCTFYQNALDVVKVSLHIRKNRMRTA